MKCCETWDRRKLKIYKPILLPSTGELRSREVVRVWRPLRTHKMLKKQYENTFSNWLKQRQSFLSDKNESIRANEQEEEEEEGQLKRTYLPPSVADANINETPKLRHWLAARNVGSRDPTRKWQGSGRRKLPDPKTLAFTTHNMSELCQRFNSLLRRGSGWVSL